MWQTVKKERIGKETNTFSQHCISSLDCDLSLIGCHVSVSLDLKTFHLGQQISVLVLVWVTVLLVWHWRAGERRSRKVTKLHNDLSNRGSRITRQGQYWLHGKMKLQQRRRAFQIRHRRRFNVYNRWSGFFVFQDINPLVCSNCTLFLILHDECDHVLH